MENYKESSQAIPPWFCWKRCPRTYAVIPHLSYTFHYEHGKVTWSQLSDKATISVRTSRTPNWQSQDGVPWWALVMQGVDSGTNIMTDRNLVTITNLHEQNHNKHTHLRMACSSKQCMDVSFDAVAGCTIIC
jgi:hypothetical protein